jgi:hypothetical protein
VEQLDRKQRSLCGHARPIIFGFSLGIFVLTFIHGFHRQSLISQSGHFPGFVNVENEVATFWLVLASLALLFRKWWSHLIAIVLGGKIVYSPGFLSLWIYANAEIGRFVEFATLKNWFRFTLETQPQYFLHAALGGIICCYAAIAPARQIIRSNRTKANKALQLTAR